MTIAKPEKPSTHAADEDKATHRNGTTENDATRGDNPMTEDALDQVIDDSFPASDPPSHTPTTSLGAPTAEPEAPEEPAAPGATTRTTLYRCLAGGGAALGAIGAFVWFRRRRSSHRRSLRDLM